MTMTIARPTTETIVVPDNRRGVRILPTWDEQHAIDDATAMRFWSKVRKTEQCWLWTGGCFDTGYGAFAIRRRNVGAHRVSWIIHHGPIPPGMEVCHNCPDGDNPQCVNPAHLFLGTHADNAADMVRKNRQARGERSGRYTQPERNARGERHGTRTHPERIPRGEKHYSAKLTWANVREIRVRRAAGESMADLAREFAVGASNIRFIVTGRTWKEDATGEDSL
jgi:hypothetical protein